MTTRGAGEDAGKLWGERCSRWRTVWQLLKKSNVHLPWDPAVTLLGTHPKDGDLSSHQTWSGMFTADESYLVVRGLHLVAINKAISSPKLEALQMSCSRRNKLVYQPEEEQQPGAPSGVTSGALSEETYPVM